MREKRRRCFYDLDSDGLGSLTRLRVLVREGGRGGGGGGRGRRVFVGWLVGEAGMCLIVCF